MFIRFRSRHVALVHHFVFIAAIVADSYIIRVVWLSACSTRQRHV